MADVAKPAKADAAKSDKKDVDPMQWYGHKKKKGEKKEEASLVADLVSMLMPLAKFGPSIGEIAFYGPILYKVQQLSAKGGNAYTDQEVMTALVCGFMLAAVDDEALSSTFGLTGELIALVPYLGCQLTILTAAKLEATLATLLAATHRVIGLRLAFMRNSEEHAKLMEDKGFKHKPGQFGKYFSKAFIAGGTTIIGFAAKHYGWADKGADLSAIVYMGWAFTEALNKANLVLNELLE